MTLLQTGQPRHQPAAGERRQEAYRERTTGAGFERGQTGGDLGQSALDRARQGRTLDGQLETLRRSPEQRRAEPQLEPAVRWLTALCVTCSSRAALVKLWCRATAS